MNEFTTDIRKKLYKDIGSLITTYFSNTKTENLELFNVTLDDYTDFFEAIRLHFIIKHINELSVIVQALNNQVNRDIFIEEKYVVNGIRGRLDIPKYIKSIHQNPTTRRFPCLTIAENFNVIENQFVILVMKYVFELITVLPISDSSFYEDYKSSAHLRLLNHIRRQLYELLHSGDLREVIEQLEIYKHTNIKKSINRIKKQVEYKEKRKMINPRTYGRLLEWWNKLIRLEEMKIDEFDFEDADFILYNSKFDDKLFELWILENIKNTLVTDFGLSVLNSNPLWKRQQQHVYELNCSHGNANNSLKIYFQKSSGLIWDSDNPPKWITFQPNTTNKDYLGGNLDVIITFNDGVMYDPILIDAKNIFYKINYKGNEVRNSSVTDKVYKMVGYLDNFHKYALAKENGLGMLIFKNKNSSCLHEKTYISGNKDASIEIFSIDPSINNAFNDICKHILNHFGCLGTRIDLQDYNNSRKIFLDNLPSSDADENNIINVHTHVLSIVSTLLRGHEEDILKHGNVLKDNRFGSVLWNKLHTNTQKYLSQAEYLLNSLSNGTNLEYSSIAVLLTKALEMELDDKFVKPFFTYLSANGIASDREPVMDNICKGKHVAIGQIGRVLSPDHNRSIHTNLNGFILTNILSGNAAQLINQVQIVKLYGGQLKDFAPNRNLTAHKDGVDFVKFCEIRDIILGIGTNKSLLIELHEVMNI